MTTQSETKVISSEIYLLKDIIAKILGFPILGDANSYALFYVSQEIGRKWINGEPKMTPT